MAQKSAARKDVRKPFDEDAYTEYASTVRGQNLLNKMFSILTAADNKFDGTILCLEVLDIKPTTRTLFGLILLFSFLEETPSEKAMNDLILKKLHKAGLHTTPAKMRKSR